MVSIIIPSYNHAQELGKTLEAIFNQDYKDFEVIVIDDGSTDNTKEVVAPYLDRIQYVFQENQGRQKARNNGFSYSKGEYLIFCDADLQMKPHMLSRLVAACDAHPEASYVYYPFQWGKKYFSSKPFNAEELKKMNYIHTSALVRRSDFPGFDESIKKFQDWDLWLTLLEKGKVGYLVDECLAYIAPNPQGLSTWLPRIAYKIPWKMFGVHIKAIEQYEEAKSVIQKKHHL